MGKMLKSMRECEDELIHDRGQPRSPGAGVSESLQQQHCQPSGPIASPQPDLTLASAKQSALAPATVVSVDASSSLLALEQLRLRQMIDEKLDQKLSALAETIGAALAEQGKKLDAMEERQRQ